MQTGQFIGNTFIQSIVNSMSAVLSLTIQTIQTLSNALDPGLVLDFSVSSSDGVIELNIRNAVIEVPVFFETLGSAMDNALIISLITIAVGLTAMVLADMPTPASFATGGFANIIATLFVYFCITLPASFARPELIFLSEPYLNNSTLRNEWMEEYARAMSQFHMYAAITTTISLLLLLLIPPVSIQALISEILVALFGSSIALMTQSIYDVGFYLPHGEQDIALGNLQALGMEALGSALGAIYSYFIGKNFVANLISWPKYILIGLMLVIFHFWLSWTFFEKMMESSS
jgi:hypothetical protein